MRKVSVSIFGVLTIGWSDMLAEAFSSNRGSRKQASSTRYSESEHEPSDSSLKTIVFIRHGRTYMNELINGVHYGQPGFTDIFDESEHEKYYDSPLSPVGMQQVRSLYDDIKELKQNHKEAAIRLGLSWDEATTFLQDLELVVTSPLTRALQTLEYGVYPHLSSHVGITALPLAAERLYLVSDLGKPASILQNQFPFVSFDLVTDHPWHYVPDASDVNRYVEWRPHGQGQQYACLGEPQEDFNTRMTQLYNWLYKRPEQVIAVVCHAGVIDWFLREVADNCQIKMVSFADMCPRGLIKSGSAG